jgi:hypothetical protein
MKKLAILLFATMLAVGCASKKTTAAMQKNTDLVSFEYEAMTRGNFKKVIVTQDSIITIKDREMRDVVKNTISKTDWESMVKALDNVNLETIETIEPPSKKHQYDGALAAYLLVTKTENSYRSSTFDHGAPPAALKPLVDKIIEVSDLPKKK